MTFKIIIFLCLVVTGYSSVHFIKYVEKPPEFANKEGCYIPELKRVLPYEVPFRPEGGKPCARYFCGRDSETQVDTCGNAASGIGCRLIPTPPDKLTAENCCGIVKCD